MRLGTRQETLRAVADRRRFGQFLRLVVVIGLCFAPSALASSSDVFFGISSFNQLRYDDEAAEVQRLGVKRMRNNIVWRDFQRSNCNDQVETGVDFSFYDTVVRRAAEHDITIIANLYGTRIGNPIPNQPCSNGADLHEFPMPSTQLYKDFVLEGGFVWQVVKRYGINGSFWTEPKNQDLTPHPIKIWEVWNEPNLRENNPDNSVSPQRYANLLIATSKTIKKAQEQMIGQTPWNVGTRVLFGGLYGDRYGPVKNAKGEWGHAEIYWHMDRYLDTAYDQPEGYTPAQLHAAFDGFSYHPYYIWGNQQDVINTIGGARVVLDQHGDTNKELWLTEIGWPVAFGLYVGIPSWSPQQVGDMLNQVLTWTHNSEAYLKAEYAAVFVYQDLPNACGDANCWPLYAGIKAANGMERPAYCRLANLTHNSGNYCEFGAPYMSTGTATNLQPQQATLNGNINPRGLKTRFTFQWGKTTSYTNENPVPPGGDAGWEWGVHPVSMTITQLSPGTTYHYRLVATNAAGTSFGKDQSFTTP